MRSNYTAIDGFGIPSASIDFISTSLSKYVESTDQRTSDSIISTLNKSGGSLKHPDASLWHPANDFLTFHDPDKRFLAELVAHNGSLPITTIETSIDWRLSDGTSDPARLRLLFDHLNHRFAPLPGMRRRHFDESRRKWRDAELNPLAPGTSSKWGYWLKHKGREYFVFARLYIKDERTGVAPGEQHFVRLEITLPGSFLADSLKETETVTEYGARGRESHRADVEVATSPFKAEDLPIFFDKIRPLLMPFFTFARGIKPPRERVRSRNEQSRLSKERVNEIEARRVCNMWKSHGAAWAIKHGHQIEPDIEINDAIGNALKALRRKMRPEFAKLSGTNLELQRES